jgi:hypothetical protein
MKFSDKLNEVEFLMLMILFILFAIAIIIRIAAITLLY